MNDLFFLETSRLLIKPLTLNDDAFILELVNTEGWLRFIGNRNVGSLIEARSYIQKIMESTNVSYWIVSLQEVGEKIGLITYIQRDYLEYPDIGFAFLPAFCKKGYAYEATSAVLKKLIAEHNLQYILATTLPENGDSIKLLKKLGLTFEKELEIGTNGLNIYGASMGNYQKGY